MMEATDNGSGFNPAVVSECMLCVCCFGGTELDISLMFFLIPPSLFSSVFVSNTCVFIQI